MKVVLCALVFLGVIGCTFAVECYSCIYNNLVIESGDKNCGDPFDKTGISKTTCDGKCTKTSTKQDGKTITVSRGCLPVCIQADCHTSGGLELCPFECCEGNLCNGAGPVTFSLVAMFAMVAMVMGTWVFS